MTLPNPIPPVLSRFDTARFWSYVDRRGPNDCWPWLKGRDADGYGHFKADHRYLRAHKIAFFLSTGSWPLLVLHDCDNPPCCNPSHLKSGTQLENMHDKIRKG